MGDLLREVHGWVVRAAAGESLTALLVPHAQDIRNLGDGPHASPHSGGTYVQYARGFQEGVGFFVNLHFNILERGHFLSLEAFWTNVFNETHPQGARCPILLGLPAYFFFRFHGCFLN